MSEETKSVCPTCGSSMCVVFAHGTHCNACGADFGQDKNPVAAAAHKRKDGGWIGGWKREPQK